MRVHRKRARLDAASVLQGVAGEAGSNLTPRVGALNVEGTRNRQAVFSPLSRASAAGSETVASIDALEGVCNDGRSKVSTDRLFRRNRIRSLPLGQAVSPRGQYFEESPPEVKG